MGRDFKFWILDQREKPRPRSVRNSSFPVGTTDIISAILIFGFA